MRRDLAVRIPPQMLLDDVYLPMAAFFRGYRLIVEETASPTTIPPPWIPSSNAKCGRWRAITRSYGPSRNCWVRATGCGCISFPTSWGRLAMPYALVALAASSLYLPGRWMALAAGGQAIFYGLAAADRWVPQTFLLKPVSSPARTFVVMMAAAVCALSVFFVSPQSLWKETKNRAGAASRRLLGMKPQSRFASLAVLAGILLFVALVYSRIPGASYCGFDDFSGAAPCGGFSGQAARVGLHGAVLRGPQVSSLVLGDESPHV